MTEYANGGWIPGTVSVTLDATQCVFSGASIRAGAMRCCRTDEQHLRLMHGNVPPYTCNLPREQDVGPDKAKHTGMNHDGNFCRDCWASWDDDTDEYYGAF